MAFVPHLDPFTMALLDALGLKGKGVVALDIRIRVNEMVTVRAELLPEQQGLSNVVRQFRLSAEPVEEGDRQA